MLPPSRGRLKAGAFDPSARGPAAAGAGREAPGSWALSAEGFLSAESTTAGLAIAGLAAAGLVTAGLATAGFAAAAFGAEVARGADLAGPDDFNFFNGALCDAFAVALPVCLFFVFVLDLVAAFFADVADWARIALPVEGLEDFLRVFLDIRLPFVAFRGSIIRVLRQAGIEQTAGRV